MRTLDEACEAQVFAFSNGEQVPLVKNIDQSIPGERKCSPFETSALVGPPFASGRFLSLFRSLTQPRFFIVNGIIVWHKLHRE
mmetsp:Transcript_54440/g.96093  ORF Transcript_54440/g.96093 Transcript_54440/m.96093 type:complete len:83 (-) Transcript_54440:316-564(-)